MKIFRIIWDFWATHQRKVWAFSFIGFILLLLQLIINADFKSARELSLISKIGGIMFLVGMGIGLSHTIISVLYRGGKWVKNISSK